MSNDPNSPNYVPPFTRVRVVNDDFYYKALPGEAVIVLPVGVDRYDLNQVHVLQIIKAIVGDVI